MNISPPSVEEYNAAVSRLEALTPPASDVALCLSSEILKEISQLNLTIGNYERWSSIQTMFVPPSNTIILDDKGEVVLAEEMPI